MTTGVYEKIEKALIGRPSWTRTNDLLLTMEVHYLLCYVSIHSIITYICFYTKLFTYLV